VDSIQTLNAKGATRISGSVSAIRYMTARLNDLAVRHHTTVFIIGHITKEGLIAGPKTLEHMVDTVLYFQGELKTDLRILRVEKNRFGPVDEIGIFQMTGQGLTAITDPAALFIQHREILEPGITIFPCMNGKRSILIEIQALVTETPFTGNPRRIAVGFDTYRMSMLISIIEKKLKLPFYKSDVFLNITGGMFVKETAGDLAVLAALVSSYKNRVTPSETIIFGEVGLTGEIRPVSSIEGRIKEGERQGFQNAIVPFQQKEANEIRKINSMAVKNIHDLYQLLTPPVRK
jgi:DNA repair protein RadA/Sms